MITRVSDGLPSLWKNPAYRYWDSNSEYPGRSRVVYPLAYICETSGRVELPSGDLQSPVLPLDYEVATALGLEPRHRLSGYSRFSKPVPYRLGLCCQTAKTGIEPIFSESESDVLPLHHLAIAGSKGFEPLSSVLETDILPFGRTTYMFHAGVEPALKD